MHPVVVMTIGTANKVIESLQEGALLRSITRTISALKHNPFYGDQIRKAQIPKQLGHLPNLWRAELANFWRMIYYIASDEHHTYVIIFEICDHQHYDGVFGYRKR
jgi:hypothetical protein